MLSYLYDNPSITSTQMTHSIKVYKSVTCHGRQFGSLRSPSTKSNAYVMASWASEDGSIDEHSKLRPGKVLLYFIHKMIINGEFKDHTLACVSWYSEHMPLKGVSVLTPCNT